MAAAAVCELLSEIDNIGFRCTVSFHAKCLMGGQYLSLAVTAFSFNDGSMNTAGSYTTREHLHCMKERKHLKVVSFLRVGATCHSDRNGMRQ